MCGRNRVGNVWWSVFLFYCFFDFMLVVGDPRVFTEVLVQWVVFVVVALGFWCLGKKRALGWGKLGC